MSWIEELYKTYENCYGNEEIQLQTNERAKKPLLPPYHTLQNSHLEIRIDGDANFIDANPIVNKNDQEIIIPCTEKSSSRTSGEEPHPLSDKIQYCAKDYIGVKKSFFSSYSMQLHKWADSKFTHPFVNTIYNYVNKGTLYSDIINTGKIFGKLDDDLGDLLIRWKVELPGENEPRCWKNHLLFDCWQKYCVSQESVMGICMVTGERRSLAINHPKRIRHSGDGGRLISSNDRTGFTFRGRFSTNIVIIDEKKEEIAIQPVSISSDVSQKAHSALRWLIDRQSFRNGDQVILSWAVSGLNTPDIFANTLSIFDESEEELKEIDIHSNNDAGQTFARKLTKKMAGFHADLKDTSKIIVMGLDSVSPGRISITFYRELSGSDFLEKLEKWHTQMAWNFLHFSQDQKNKKKSQNGYLHFAPAILSIAEACYGRKRNKDKDFIKFKKSIIERLLPCIIDSKAIPVDIMETAVRKASNRLAFKEGESWQWERTLSVACSLYRCYSIRTSNNKNQYAMALEYERSDRDYLYGRLLAAAEYLEENALHLAGENRITNAARLMQRFSDQPFQTWLSIEKSLDPYKTRLQIKRPKKLFFLKNLIDEIHNIFLPGDYEKEGRLSGLYLLGYHCQRLELIRKNYKEVKESETEN